MSIAIQRIKRAIQDMPNGGMQTGKQSIKLAYPDAQRAIVEIEALQSESDALLAQNHELKGLIMRLRDRWWPFVHVSVAPSSTAYNLGKESADVLCKSPQQHLADIKAEAGRAGFIAGYMAPVLFDDDGSESLWAEGEAKLYADKVRHGGE